MLNKKQVNWCEVINTLSLQILQSHLDAVSTQNQHQYNQHDQVFLEYVGQIPEVNRLLQTVLLSRLYCIAQRSQ